MLPGLLCLALLSSAGCSREKGKSGKAKPAVPVLTAEVAVRPMPVEIRTFGTVEPAISVTLKSQITGLLTKINFKEGQDVKKGDILFTIDSLPFENDLKQAESTLSRDRLQCENAQKEAQRQDELLKKGLTSQDMYDQAKTTADAFAATVKAEEAVVENAKVQLGYCTIISPINGRTGKYLIDEGNLVKANETVLNTVNQIKPIEVSFTVPEQNLGEISRQMSRGSLEVKAFLPDEPEKPESGTLTFIDNAVDRSTGTISLKAVFSNDNMRLWPGQYVKLLLVLSVQSDAIVVPSEAVQTGQKGTYVFVIRPDMSAENRPVKVARQLDNFTVIAEGLKAGEPVVIEGYQRIGLDTRVEIRNDSATAPSSKP